MSTSLITVLASGITALFLISLFSIERKRGVRFGEALRSLFDRVLGGLKRGMVRRLPEVNTAFFQELIHFITHLILSKTLGFLRSLESLTLTVVRFNRKQALKLRRKAQVSEEVVRTTDVVTSLQAVVDHKKAVELTEKQKEKRKNAALEGDAKL
jgi:hypothetical protein